MTQPTDATMLASNLRTLSRTIGNVQIGMEAMHAESMAGVARDLLTYAAELDPARCPPACREAHTYEWPCALGPASPKVAPRRIVGTRLTVIPAKDMDDVDKINAHLSALTAQGDPEWGDIVVLSATTGNGDVERFIETAPGLAAHVLLRAEWYDRA